MTSLFAPRNIPSAEEIRTLIDGREALLALNAIDQVLQARGANITKNEVAALNLRVKIQFGKLAKVLPDLKAIEHSGQGGGPIKFEKIERTIVDPSLMSNANAQDSDG